MKLKQLQVNLKIKLHQNISKTFFNFSKSAEVFHKMLETNDKLAVIFFESSSVKSSLVLEELENIGKLNQLSWLYRISI